MGAYEQIFRGPGTARLDLRRRDGDKYTTLSIDGGGLWRPGHGGLQRIPGADKASRHRGDSRWSSVNLLDDGWLCQHQVFVAALRGLAAIILRRQLIALYICPHRAVVNQDALCQGL